MQKLAPFQWSPRCGGRIHQLQHKRPARAYLRAARQEITANLKEPLGRRFELKSAQRTSASSTLDLPLDWQPTTATCGRSRPSVGIPAFLHAWATMKHLPRLHARTLAKMSCSLFTIGTSPWPSDIGQAMFKRSIWCVSRGQELVTRGTTLYRMTTRCRHDTRRRKERGNSYS